MQYQPPTHADDASRAPPAAATSLTLGALLALGLWSPTTALVAALVSVVGLVALVAATREIRSGVTVSRSSRPVRR